MEYLVKSGSPIKQRTGCVVVGIFERRSPSKEATLMDEAIDGRIASVMRRGDMDGRLGQTTILHGLEGAFADRVMLVGCGKERSFNASAYIKACEAAGEKLDAIGGVDASIYLTQLNIKGIEDFVWPIKQAMMAFERKFYRFEAHRGSGFREEDRKLARITFQVPRRSDLPEAERAVSEGVSICNGIKLAKDLGNTPPNICTPTYLAHQAKDLAEQFYQVNTRVYDEVEIDGLGMGALAAVARGAAEPPRFIVVDFMNAPDAKTKPIVLVGKGITFDAGGISLKPSGQMDEMKYDMAGAASVLGTIHAAADLDLPINVIGVIPAAENVPDGGAYKPGDIVTSLSGQTIEVLNTDAEGRLALADALTWVDQNYEPDAVIDIATLTGAAVVALGQHAAALFGNNSPLRRSLQSAGTRIHDRAWPMPLWSDYQTELDSNFADMANVGGRDAGAVVAACFLSRFSRKMRWAHLDVAGVAWQSGKDKGATGRPVGLLTEYLIGRTRDDD